MKFRTEIQIKPFENKINHNSKLLLIGSCFSDNIFEKLYRFKYNALNKPSGTIYNPVSIRNCIRFLVENHQFTKADLFEHDGIYYSHDFHSDFSNQDQNQLIEQINSSISISSKQLKKASHCFITLGSSFVYQLKDTDEIVANCHKRTASDFKHYILNFETCQKMIAESIDLVQSVNPSCSIILTVSPIRYLTSGFDQNQLNKANLVSACHHEINSKTNVLYFPAYEIMMDDLRDYRFYADDLIHPNQQAIDYIWLKFLEMFISKEELKLIDQIEKIMQAVNHRPRQGNSETHQKFIEQTMISIKKLEKDYKLDFSDETDRLINY